MNPLDLPGPQFLVFYLVVGAATLGWFWYGQWQQENGRPAGLGVSDPYLVAYLRGGSNEALRVAVVTLIDRGLIEANGDQLTSKADAATLAQHPLERAVLGFYRDGHAAPAIFAVASGFRATWDEYDARLRQAGLIPDSAMQDRRRTRLRIVLAVLLGLAGAKLAVALSRGRTNVMFLILLAIAFTVIAWKISRVRRTVLGDRVLADLRSLFSRLKDRAGSVVPGGASRDVALLAAVFGLAALPNEAFPYVRQIYPRASSSNRSCGSSCGSSCGGGDGGGGCGGCGGGGGGD